VRETTHEKAVRILAAQGVRFSLLLPDEAQAVIRGDSGDHTCWYDGRQWNCSCYSGRHSCSHVLAATIVYRAALPAAEKLLEEARKMIERGE
jgi:hypothetical protein